MPPRREDHAQGPVLGAFPHSDAGHARLPRVHGHLRMDAPQEHKARLQPPRHRSAGGGWGPGHGGTAQPIACAPSALARAQAPEPLVRVPQRRAHRARRQGHTRCSH